MTDWAAKVLEGVERYTPPYTKGNWIKEADALAAIARMGAGDGLVAELEMSARIWEKAADHKDAPTFSRGDCRVWAERFANAAAHIAALKAQNRELALDVLASSGQAQEAYAAQLAAEAERDALRDRVEKDAKAHEKEIAVWAENYDALRAKGADARAEALKEAAAIADDFADKSIVDAAFWRKDGMPKTAVISEQHAKAARLVAAAIRDMIGGAE